MRVRLDILFANFEIELANKLWIQAEDVWVHGDMSICSIIMLTMLNLFKINYFAKRCLWMRFHKSILLQNDKCIVLHVKLSSKVLKTVWVFTTISKGQEISEWIHEVVALPKIWKKKLEKFCLEVWAMRRLNILILKSPDLSAYLNVPKFPKYF